MGSTSDGFHGGVGLKIDRYKIPESIFGLMVIYAVVTGMFILDYVVTT